MKLRSVVWAAVLAVLLMMRPVGAGRLPAEAYLFATPTPGAFALQVRPASEGDPAPSFDAGKIQVWVSDDAGRRFSPPLALLPLKGAPAGLESLPQAASSHWFALKFAPGVLPPDLYTLRVNIPPLAVSGELRVSLPPPPDRAPALVPGQRFLYVPPDGPGPVFQGADGRAVPPAALALQVLTLRSVGVADGSGARLSFDAPPAARRVSLDADPHALGAAGLLPLIEDAALRRLRARYEGRRVWVSHGLPVECGAGDAEGAMFVDGAGTSFVLQKLVRVSAGGIDLAMNGGPGATDLSLSDFSAVSPLVAVFAAPQGLKVIGSASSGPNLGAGQQKCRVAYQFFADGWQMDRALSLAPPRPARGPLRRGMMPEQVIAVQGWPTEYGSLADLKKRPVWRYDTTKPFTDHVYFRHGRFARLVSGGSLP